MNGPKQIWRAAKIAQRTERFHSRLALAKARLRWRQRYGRVAVAGAVRR